MNSLPLLEPLSRDLRYAFRSLCKSPGFTAVAVLTLALGIGANTAIFSFVDCLVLRPLPVQTPGNVVFLTSARKGRNPGTAFSYPDFLDIQKETTYVFSDVSAVGIFGMDGLTVDGRSQPIWPSYVTGNFFRLLGLRPALGRLFLASEGSVAGSDPVLVLSYAYWRSRFNGNPDVVGKKASVNGIPVTIIGVAPADFHGLTSLMDFQGYIPLGMAAALQDAPVDFPIARANAAVGLVARLKTRVSLQQADATLSLAARRLSQQYPATDAKMLMSALHLGPNGMMFDPTNPETLPLLSSVFLILAASVLIIACMNIANLVLVRAVSRQREMALRAALGATRGRLIRLLLTESLLLALLGCCAGVVLGLGGSHAFGSIPLHTSLPILLHFRFDWRVFVYALGVAILTGTLVGIVPALGAASGNLSGILKEGGRTASAGGRRMRSVLVAIQLIGSLMLLIVAGLFVRSLEKAQRTNLGFDPNHVLNLTIDAHAAGYDETHGRVFFHTLLDRACSLPGVQAASLALSVPLGYGGGAGATLKIDGYEPPNNQENPLAGYNAISSGYFQTMHIALLRGREIQDSDTQNSQRVAIIDQTMANRFWSGRDPVGHYFSTTDDPGHPVAVIGIAANAVQSQIFWPDQPFFYMPLYQQYNPVLTLQVRSAAAPDEIARAATALVHSLEPGMPVIDVQPMTTALDTLNGFLMFRLAATLAASLGILGLILAIVGVYGIITYAASQRTHEVGIRLALGAPALQILKVLFIEGLAIVATGVIGGVLAGAGIARLAGSFLFGVSPFDPLTYSIVSALLAAVALLACYIPARQVMKIDPVVALRHE
jgi:predicted permease